MPAPEQRPGESPADYDRRTLWFLEPKPDNEKREALHNARTHVSAAMKEIDAGLNGADMTLCRNTARQYLQTALDDLK